MLSTQIGFTVLFSLYITYFFSEEECHVTHCINEDDSIFPLISEVHSCRFISSSGRSVFCHIILGSGILN